MSPSTGKAWASAHGSGIEGLTLDSSAPIPALESDSCLIKIEAVSLNYRDIARAKALYPSPSTDTIVPCSDAAGTIVAIGPNVTEFAVGDKVCNTFFLDYVSGFLTPKQKLSNLGAMNDGVLREYVVFPKRAVVKAPKNLNMIEASTLPCAALTAWNALFGLEGRKLQKGQTVLTQGTGGVSMFAIQFALATGAEVIATTGSKDKEAKLKAMGVKNVINYRKVEDWGKKAKEMSKDGLGVEHVIEVGGASSLKESIAAVKVEGVVNIIGFLGEDKSNTSIVWDVLMSTSLVRGLQVGSKEQFQDMNKFIEQHNIKPVVDDQIFAFHQAKEAYQYLSDQKFFGKVVIKGVEA